MKAIFVEEATQRLYIGDMPDPIPGDHDLLVSVQATAVNRADLIQRMGKYPPPPGASPIIGLEMAGVVERVGQHVHDWKVGDRVCALLPGGGYAQKAVIPARMAMAIPDGFSFEEAAAIPEVFLTAYLNVCVLGQLKAEDVVLIHAAASGVGTAAIQLAREVGAIPIATASSAEKLEVCKSLGAQLLVNYKEENFAERVSVFTDGQGVDVILDPVGASYWKQNSDSIGFDGRWVVIGGLGGAQVESFNFQTLMRRRAQLIFSTLRGLPVEDKIKLTQQFIHFAADRFADGRLKPIVDRVYDWEDVMEAHEQMKQNQNIGKMVLAVH